MAQRDFVAEALSRAERIYDAADPNDVAAVYKACGAVLEILKAMYVEAVTSAPQVMSLADLVQQVKDKKAADAAEVKDPATPSTVKAPHAGQYL